jgi:hypothetical protein
MSMMAVRFAVKICVMEKLFEQVYAIFTADYGCKRRAEELSELYKLIGGASMAFDNMLYERLGISCEDLIDMLRKGRQKIY